MTISRLASATPSKGKPLSEPQNHDVIERGAPGIAATAAARVVTVRYFSWVREKAGLAEERLDLPADVATVADLVALLRARGGGYEDAFGAPGVVRAAVDQMHVKPSHRLGDAREIAFFPPVTGG